MYRESVWVQVVAFQDTSEDTASPVVEIELPQTPFGPMRCQATDEDRAHWPNLVGKMTLVHLHLVQAQVKLTYQLPQMHILKANDKKRPDQACIVGQIDGLSRPNEPFEWMVRTLFPFLLTQVSGHLPECELTDMIEVTGALGCFLEK